MEDFLGILMFILYIVFTVTRNRKKGMQKNRNRRSPQPIKEVRDTRVKEQPRAVKRTVENAPAAMPAVADKTYGKGSSVYPEPNANNYELSSYESKQAPVEETFEPIAGSPAGSYEESALQPAISLDKASILQAMIWNEILQKPKSRRRHA